MSHPSQKYHPGGESALPELVEVGLYASEREALQHSLVILAMGQSCWFVFSPEGWRLLVESSILAHARYQLSCYDRESQGWPPPAPAPQAVVGRLEFGPSLVWASLVVLGFWAQQRLGPGLTDRCCMDSTALFVGHEFWRPLTALFMHADLAHLVGNLLSGFFVFATLSTVFPRARAFGLLALGSVLANTGVGFVYLQADYRSLGASTAVFCALGMLTGAALRHGMRVGLRNHHRRILVPLASGLGILALFGAGGLQTDLAAHLAGFLTGLLGGVLGAPSTGPGKRT